MILADKITSPDGWNYQAKRLTVAHTALGLDVISAARRIGSSKRARGRQISNRESVPTPRESEPPNGPGPSRATLGELRLQRQLESGAVIEQRRSNPEQTSAMQATAADRSLVDADDDFDPAREEFARQDNEIRSLQTSLELTIGENARLAERLAESDKALDHLKNQLEQMNQKLSTVEAAGDDLATAADKADAESAMIASASSQPDGATTLAASDVVRSELGALLNELTKQHAVETETFLSQLNAVLSRAVSAEERLAEAQHSLLALSKESNLAVGEHLKLSARLAASDLELQNTRCKLERANAALVAVKAENGELFSALDKAEKRRLNEVNALVSRLETMVLRAVKAETLLTETRRNLSEKFDLLQNSLEVKSRQIYELEQSRAVLAANTDALLDRVDARDKALAEAEVTIKVLADRVARPEIALDEQALELGARPPSSTQMLLASTIAF